MEDLLSGSGYFQLFPFMVQHGNSKFPVPAHYFDMIEVSMSDDNVSSLMILVLKDIYLNSHTVSVT